MTINELEIFWANRADEFRAPSAEARRSEQERLALKDLAGSLRRAGLGKLIPPLEPGFKERGPR